MEGALVELLNLTVERFPDLNKDALLKGLLRRENTMTTYLGLGVAMPHVRVKMGRRYILAVGRSHYGIRYDGAMENEPVRLVFMLIADEKTRDYLQLLAGLAAVLKEQDFVDSLVQAPDLDALFDRLFTGFGGMAAKPVAAPQTRVNRVILRESEKIATAGGCTGIMVFGDTFDGGMPISLSFLSLGLAKRRCRLRFWMSLTMSQLTSRCRAVSWMVVNFESSSA